MGGAMASFPTALFLREPEVRRGLELMFAGQGALARAVEPILARSGLGRAHQRALYFIGRHPDETVGALLTRLGITKQSLHRVLNDLVERGLVEMRVGRDDRRQRLLRLTESGGALEAELFEAMRAKLAAAYARAGQQAVGGFWAVLEGLS
jgi:DNA-binding MarR family transcriptional regulator